MQSADGPTILSRSQFVPLFLSRLVLLTVGGGLFPLLPLYAIRLGASPAVAGNYLSFSFLALAIGTLVAGWLADRFQRRKALLVASGVLVIPALMAMSRVTSIGQLAVLTATVWFLSGIGHTLISILTGLFAEEAERGKVFGTLELTTGLAAVFSGLTFGRIADTWGYPSLFMFTGFLWILFPLIGLRIQDRVIDRAAAQEVSGDGGSLKLRGGLLLLLVASVLAQIAGSVGSLGTSLAMDKLGHLATAISSTGIVGGAAILLLLPIIGRLSDHARRKNYLVLGYLVGAAGLVVLVASVRLWHFWIAAALLFVSYSGSRVVGSTMVTDLVAKRSLGRGLSLFHMTYWVGAVVGLSGTGYAIENLGMSSALILGALIPLVAIALLIPFREARRKHAGVAP